MDDAHLPFSWLRDMVHKVQGVSAIRKTCVQRLTSRDVSVGVLYTDGHRIRKSIHWVKIQIYICLISAKWVRLRLNEQFACMYFLSA